jgi:hypothetical protein
MEGEGQNKSRDLKENRKTRCPININSGGIMINTKLMQKYVLKNILQQAVLYFLVLLGLYYLAFFLHPINSTITPNIIAFILDAVLILVIGKVLLAVGIPRLPILKVEDRDKLSITFYGSMILMLIYAMFIMVLPGNISVNSAIVPIVSIAIAFSLTIMFVSRIKLVKKVVWQ